MDDFKLKDDVSCIHLEEEGKGFFCWMNGNNGKLLQMLVTASSAFLTSEDTEAEESREMFDLICRLTMTQALKRRPEFKQTYMENTLFGLCKKAMDIVMDEDEEEDYE